MAPPDDATVLTLIGSDFIVRGRLLRSGVQRVSDHLNESSGRPMLVLGDATLEGAEGFGTDLSEVAVTTSQLLFVIPDKERPPLVELRVAKQRRRMRMLVGDYIVDGDMHMVPDITVERFVNMGGSEFLPVTDAEIIGTEMERREAMLLVRRHAIRMLTPIEVAVAR
ncbi:MAG: hypothetical protein E6J14_03980 [Chloroflexi bacterium]|nr:MAG: hypothetical protein E6J14_03980 [Chloroflexota bacterium]